jgi:hypothetical protein
MTDGKKSDKNKTNWSLVPWKEIEGLAECMTYGAIKYNENPLDPNWKKVDDGFNRYFSAFMRHLQAYRDGEKIDPESGLEHRKHLLFNAVCLSHFMK